MQCILLRNYTSQILKYDFRFKSTINIASYENELYEALGHSIAYLESCISQVILCHCLAFFLVGFPWLDVPTCGHAGVLGDKRRQHFKAFRQCSQVVHVGSPRVPRLRLPVQICMLIWIAC